MGKHAAGKSRHISGPELMEYGVGGDVSLWGFMFFNVS